MSEMPQPFGDGHLLRCRSSTMSRHRLRRGALHLPVPGALQARRCSRQNANLFLREPLEVEFLKATSKTQRLQGTKNNNAVEICVDRKRIVE